MSRDPLIKVVGLYGYVLMTLQPRYDSYLSLRKSQNTRRVAILSKLKVTQYKHVIHHLKANFSTVLTVVLLSP